jgi:hypothetical protein
MWIATVLSLLLAPQPVVEGRAVRASLKSVERGIDERVQRMVDRAPFVLLGTTRGGYLPGYGAVFTLEVNLVPVAGISPFRPAYTPQEIQNINRQKREKLGTLRAALRPLLVDQAANLSQVPPNEKVALIVSLFNHHWEDTTGLPSQIVLQATRQSLLDLAARRANGADLERAIEMRDF